ncbi:MAG: DUF975 family protein [Christensenellales bacterium]|jgi:uncharacterized membrane protein
MMMYASDTRKAARHALANNWGIALAVTLVAGLLGGGFSGGSSGISSNISSGGYYDVSIWPILFIPLLILCLIGLALFLIGPAIWQGLYKFNINLVTRTEQRGFQTLFGQFHYWGKALGLHLLIALRIFLWSLLFIVPGIIAYYRYAMAPYIMANNPDVGILEAIHISTDMMRGNKGRLFCLEFSFIGWILLAMLTCGIGFLWLVPYINAATAVFYVDLAYRYAGQTSPFAGYAVPSPASPQAPVA